VFFLTKLASQRKMAGPRSGELDTIEGFAVVGTSDNAASMSDTGENLVVGDPEAGGGTMPNSGTLGEDVVADGIDIHMAAGSGAGPLSSDAVEVDPEDNLGDDDMHSSAQLSEIGSDASNLWIGSISDSSDGTHAEFRDKVGYVRFDLSGSKREDSDRAMIEAHVAASEQQIMPPGSPCTLPPAVIRPGVRRQKDAPRGSGRLMRCTI
jgi:hypothetical protein